MTSSCRVRFISSKDYKLWPEIWTLLRGAGHINAQLLQFSVSTTGFMAFMKCNTENYPTDNNVESNIRAKSVLQVVNDEDITYFGKCNWM
jgi:hypothetical protein